MGKRSKVAIFSLLGVLGLAAITVIFVVLSGQDEDPVESFDQTPVSIRESFDPGLGQPIDRASETKASGSAAEEGLRGLVIDGQSGVVPQGDILYKFVSRNGASCNDAKGVDFDLNPDTGITQSDKHGQFTIPWSKADTFSSDITCLVLHGSKAGYASTVAILDLATARSADAIIELELDKHRVLRGNVMSPAGRVVSGAEVKAWVADRREASQPASLCSAVDKETLATGMSATDGSFDIEAPGDNVYCVQASHPDWSSSEIQTVDLSLRDPAALVLIVEPPLSLSGRVTDQNGRGVAELTLRLRSHNEDDSIAITSSDALGHFVFRKLEPVAYALSSADPGYEIAKPKEVVIKRSESGKEVDVSVFPLTTITGRVVDPTGKPVSGVQVSTRSPYVPDLTTSFATSNSDGYFEIPSEHRSKAVHDMQRMASEFSESGAQQAMVSPVSCVSFYHTHYRGDERAITTTDTSFEMGTIYLEPPLWEFTGVVRNHRGQPVEAQLTFNYIDERRTSSSEPPSQCDQSMAPRIVGTDEQGRFELNVDALGRYELDVRTERYKPRKIEIVLGEMGGMLEIDLE